MSTSTGGVDYRSLWDLDGKAFIVVGAGNGIGLAISEALAQLGARLACVEVDAGRAAQVAETVGGVPVVVDATTSEGVATAIEAAYDAFGHVDGAVDILGRATRATIDDLRPEAWDAEFDMNVRHAYLLGHLLGPRLAQGGGGSLTFIASNSAHHGNHVTPAYAAAKAALLSWVKSLAATYGPAGVRANAVSPGVTLTDRMSAIIGPDLPQWTRLTTLKELNRPADVAAAVAFLASPAARTVTGHELLVDGGTGVRDVYYGDPQDSSFADDVYR